MHAVRHLRKSVSVWRAFNNKNERSMNSFDIIVIGAGPAGAMAAQAASKGGRNVCLLERKEKAGTPVRCGEGIGLKGAFSNEFEIDTNWIKAKISRVKLISPSGIAVTLVNSVDSYVVDREIMDLDLVKRAISLGAHYQANTPVISINRNDKNLYECKSPKESYFAPCVILADGVESRLARDLCWQTALDPVDLETCAFCKVTHESIDAESCIFYIGNNITPAGYAWVFPRGNNQANIGLGVLGSNSSAGKAKALLEKFVAVKFPGAQMIDLHCGGVPAGKWLKPLVKDGAMVVGDAARQVISLTGAGINYSVYAGQLAGKIAAEAFHNGSVDYKHLQTYEKIWAKGLGKQQMRSYALKTLLIKKHDDVFLDGIAKALSKKDSKKLSILEVFLRTFISNPVAFIKALLLFR